MSPIGDIQTQENIIFLWSHDPDIGCERLSCDRTELDMDWKAHGETVPKAGWSCLYILAQRAPYSNPTKT